MLAEFEIIGKVGKVKINKGKGGKLSLFISVVTSKYYNGNWYQTWHNNIIAHGIIAETIQKRVAVGNLVRLHGDITVKKIEGTKFGEKNFLVIKSFLNVAKTQEERSRYMNEKDKEEPDIQDENTYDTYDGDGGSDSTKM